MYDHGRWKGGRHHFTQLRFEKKKSTLERWLVRGDTGAYSIIMTLVFRKSTASRAGYAEQSGLDSAKEVLGV